MHGIHGQRMEVCQVLLEAKAEFQQDCLLVGRCHVLGGFFFNGSVFNEKGELENSQRIEIDMCIHAEAFLRPQIGLTHLAEVDT